MFDIKRPCIKKCALDENEVCLGCFRTFDDMRIWNQSTDEEKLKILKNALKRRNEYR